MRKEWESVMLLDQLGLEAERLHVWCLAAGAGGLWMQSQGLWLCRVEAVRPRDPPKSQPWG